MAGKSSLDRALKKIEWWFEQSPKPVFRKAQLEWIFLRQRQDWKLAAGVTFEEFERFLGKKSKLKKYVLDFPYLPVTLFTWGEDASVYEAALLVGKGAYFSHYTAAFLHELTEQVPRTLFVTVPQPLKRPETIVLTQKQIDQAFAQPARTTKSIAKLGAYRVARLSGMETADLEIMPATAPDGGQIRVSSLERTLIDMVVRPEYSGGIHEVLQAFRLAKSNISINTLVATIKRLNYIYPYHQAVGFYLQRSGVYSQSAWRMLARLEKPYDFYLVHGARQTDYSAEWRLFFPKGF